MAEVKANITKYLSSNDIDYELLEHTEPAFTSQEAAELRNVELSKVVKSMIFLYDDREILIVVLSSNKTNRFETTQECRIYDRLEFADESDIEERLGYEVDAIPPFSLNPRC